MIPIIPLALLLSQKPLSDVFIGEQPHEAIRLRVGQKLVFSVSENVSTGASWDVKYSHSHGMTYLGKAYAPDPEKKPQLAGHPSTALFSFKPTKPGRYWVSLTYGRSWEMKKGTKPWEQINAKILVK
jgi:predicted secreted protein